MPCALASRREALSVSMERFKLTRYHCNHDSRYFYKIKRHTCTVKPSDWILRLNLIILFFWLSLFGCLGKYRSRKCYLDSLVMLHAMVVRAFRDPLHHGGAANDTADTGNVYRKFLMIDGSLNFGCWLCVRLSTLSCFGRHFGWCLKDTWSCESNLSLIWVIASGD